MGIPDDLLRPACEAAVEVARLGSSARPPLQVPGPLRPLTKLRNLPGPALPAVRKVLDDDEVFRSIVAASTTEELVGRASWLYLQRADGWEDALEREAGAAMAAAAEAEEARTEATAARRLAAVEDALRRSEAEVADLRRQLTRAKDRIGEERKARRDADSELGRLRRRVADLEAELDRASAPPASAPAPPPEPPQDTSALLDRLATLERRLAEPRPVPDPQPVLRALDALDQVRDELGGWLAESTEPAPRPPRPAPEPRRRPSPLPPAVFGDTVEAADHLLRLPRAVVLVDGYNVSLGRHPDLALPEQRRWLLDSAGALAARTDAEIHVVFDGVDDAPSVPAPGPRRGAVHARYTETGVEADDVLLDLTADVPISRPVIVVSDDRRVRDGAVDLGANVLGAAVFVEVLGRR